MSQLLRQKKLTCDTSGKYTLNYRAESTERSVRKEFFLNGNTAMNKRYNGRYPWRK
jgi:hypothetical protein